MASIFWLNEIGAVSYIGGLTGKTTIKLTSESLPLLRSRYCQF